ncbi:LysM peptidoglycan-binding domain-containing protein [Kribbella aluminosa]
MIRALKGILAVLALAGLGWLLRWMTAGSISGLRTYDLDSLTVLAVGTIAWIAYSWLALAVVLTVLEQVPGVVGALAGAVAGRITTKTARALLRSGLGVAAVTPLTVGVAHAAPTDSAHVRHVTRSDPQSATQFTSTEAASKLEIGGTQQGDYRATEQASHLEIGATDQADYRATEPPSELQITPTKPAAERTGSGSPTTPGQGTGSSQRTTGAQQPDGRVGVPDRPTDGAPTRYTDLRPAVPVSVVVREGDSLWSIAARELGPSATNEAIAARWHDWYSANRHVIGNDPDLILPGQVLRTPPAPHGDRLPPHQQEQ